MKTYRHFLISLFFLMAADAVKAGDVLKVCGQNLQNYFWSLDRERTQDNSVAVSNYNTEEGRLMKTQRIVDALSPLKADIYVFNELEAKPVILPYLAEQLSDATGLNYAAVSDDIDYDLSRYPMGMIKSGYIYRTDHVAPYGDNVTTAVGYTFHYNFTMRMQTFKSLATDECFTLSMNHFKAGGTDQNKETRIANAQSLLQGLQTALDPDILLMGDLNCEPTEIAFQVLVDAGYEEQLMKYVEGDIYTYSWSRGTNFLDHVMANSTMAEQVTSADVLHIANKYDVGEMKAYSDHDPYVVMLDLKSGGNTGIREIENEEMGIGESDYFNLSGLRVTQPQKGIYIVRGKKVVIR